MSAHDAVRADRSHIHRARARPAYRPTYRFRTKSLSGRAFPISLAPSSRATWPRGPSTGARSIIQWAHARPSPRSWPAHPDGHRRARRALAIYLPNATMAGILFIVAYGLWDSHHIKQIIRTSYSDTAVLAVTFGAALALELDKAIFAGVLISLLLDCGRPRTRKSISASPIRRTRGGNSPTRAPDCRNACRVRVIRIDGSLFFGAVNASRRHCAATRNRRPVQASYDVMQAVNFITWPVQKHWWRWPALPGARRRPLFDPAKKAVVELLERGHYMAKSAWRTCSTPRPSL